MQRSQLFYGTSHLLHVCIVTHLKHLQFFSVFLALAQMRVLFLKSIRSASFIFIMHLSKLHVFWHKSTFVRAQGPVRPGVVGCRWSLRACRHGTLGRLHCGCRRSRLRALLCPFLGGGRGCPCGGSPGGPVPWGSLDVWGPGLFRACFMPCGMGLLFPTHTIKHLHGGTLWTQARSHTQVYTQAFTLV